MSKVRQQSRFQTILLSLIIIFFIVQQSCHAIQDTTKLQQLEQQLRQVAGVYKDRRSRFHPDIDLSKTVLITACNYGFINHLHNFKCFVDRLGMKFLVIAMDKQAYNYLTNHTSMHTFFMTGGSIGEVTGLPQEFRSKQFNLITAKKKEIVHDILMLGYDVLFSDTDVAMIRDPLPYMIRINVDYAHTLNYMCTV